MLAKIKERASGEGGFTLIELLIVLIIIGILIAIAVPSYLGFKDRAENRAAQANVRSAIPAVEAYQVDNGSYASMNLAALRAIDTGVKLADVAVISSGVGTPPGVNDGYCITSTSTGVAGDPKPHRYRGGQHPSGVTTGVVEAGTC